MQPYLPIVRVFLLLGGATPDMRERLIQRVEAALRSEDSIVFGGARAGAAGVSFGSKSFPWA
jgi:hypothetical protein